MKKNDNIFDLLDDYMENEFSNISEDDLIEEDLELFHFSKKLVDSNKDIKSKNKEASYKKILDDKYKEREDMNNKFFNKKVVGFGVAVLIGITSVQTGFAQNMYQKIREAISLNYVTVEIDEPVGDMPKELMGKLFDKDGNVLTVVNEDTIPYDKDGNILKEIVIDGQTISLEKSDEVESEDDYFFTNDLELANSKLDFDLKVPTYLPEGYSLKEIVMYKNSASEISSEYCDLEYSDGKNNFFIMQRLASPENAFTSGDSDPKELNINGNRAILTKDKNIDIEMDDVIISVLGRKALNKDKVIKVTESLK